MYALRKREIEVKLNNVGEKSIKRFFWWWAGYCKVCLVFYIYIASHHSAAEHGASTRILGLTLFLASVWISTQVLLTPVASSSTVLRHLVFHRAHKFTNGMVYHEAGYDNL
jgi:hypothetical protein